MVFVIELLSQPVFVIGTLIFFLLLALRLTYGWLISNKEWLKNVPEPQRKSWLGHDTWVSNTFNLQLCNV